MIKLARKYHKWLMAFIGLQFLIWSITGFYMVTMDIHEIHGESMVKPSNPALDLSQVDYSMTELFQAYPDASRLSLVQLEGKPVYQFRSALAQPSTSEPKPAWVVLNSVNGARLPAITKERAAAIAQSFYIEAHPIADIRLLTDQAPSELSSRHLPVWQVTFEHLSSPTFYISQQTGELVTKRHVYWRIFDWMWRFHIMEYIDGEDTSNRLLFFAALLGLIAALAGAILTYAHIIKPKLKSRVYHNARKVQGGNA